MSLIDIRKRSLTIETIHHEGGPPPDEPLRLAASCAVIRNPYAGRYEPDLMPFMAELRALGTLLAQELVDTLPEGIDTERIQALIAVNVVAHKGAIQGAGQRNEARVALGAAVADGASKHGMQLGG